MKYMLIIHGNEEKDSARSPKELEAEMAAYYAFTDELVKAGAMVSGEALHPSSSATVVKVRDGKTVTTDGPFAETKEQCGGYYVINSANLDEAIKWAAKIPHAASSGIEVRPVMDFSQAVSA